jgi:hypothetical protein
MYPQNPNYPQGAQGPYTQPVFDYPPVPGPYSTPPGYPGAYPGYPGAYGPPTPPPASGKKKLLAASLVTAVLLGGGGYAAYHVVQNLRASDCSVRGAETVTLDTRSADEPRISVPVTAGWRNYTRDDLEAEGIEMDSPTIRGFIANPGLQEQGFVPNIVVTLKKFDDAIISPEAINDLDEAEISRLGTIVNRSTSTVCGSTVFRRDLTDIPSSRDGRSQDGTSLLTVVEGPDGSPWVATAGIQTRDPDNPEFVAQLDALVRGFHLTALEK